MGEYDSSIALADRLIRKKGRLVTLIEKMIQPPTDGSDVGFSEETRHENIPALILPPDTMTGQAYADQTASGTDTYTRVRNVSVPALSCPVRIDASMKLEVDEVQWQIVGVKVLEPSGEPILYQFTIRV